MAVRDPVLAGWLLDSLSSGLVAIDAHGAISGLNHAAQRVLGAPRGDAAQSLGRPLREVLHSRPEIVELLEDALDGHERPSRAELVLPGSSGTAECTIGFTLSTVRDHGGTVRGAAIQFRDLSAFERDGEQARLRDRLAVLGEMAAGLAHELRNPLAGMEVIAGLLERRLPPGGEEHPLVLDLLAQLRVVAETLDRTLDFVRPPALEGAPVDPVALLDLAAGRACARVPFPGEVERVYQADAPRAFGDPDQLLVALTDMVVNALEAMTAVPGLPAPRLVLEVRSEQRPAPRAPVRLSGGTFPAGSDSHTHREVVLGIADSGPGIPRGLRERIFHPFFTTKDAGSGVGLSNAQKVVTSLGGSIELESVEGSGTLFRVRLPAAEKGEP